VLPTCPENGPISLFLGTLGTNTVTESFTTYAD